MNNILVDTGFWYGLYDKRDNYFHQANELYEYVSLGKVLLPYPTLYETINTRFAKNRTGLLSFETFINQPNVTLIEDNDYKEKALKLTFNSSIRLDNPYSFVDMILRLMLADPTLRIGYLLSFNPEDFWDVCHNRNIKILSE